MCGIAGIQGEPWQARCQPKQHPSLQCRPGGWRWRAAKKFSIVTPSFRNASWLKLCIASVAVQQGVGHEHIVQDACPDDGTADWPPHDTRVRAFIEKDAGMHDAVNRGWRRATGAEQYLPGALATVAQHFDAHPEADVVISDTVAVEVGDPQTLGMKAFGCLAGRSGRETGESATLMDVAGLCAESHTESVAEGARNVVPGRKGGKVLGDGSH